MTLIIENTVAVAKLTFRGQINGSFNQVKTNQNLKRMVSQAGKQVASSRSRRK